jgi:hypothetical protein
MDETVKAKAAYFEYESMGVNRSMAKLCVLLGKPSGYTRQLETWSSQFHWQTRVTAYDAAQLAKEVAERRKKQNEAIEAMNTRQAIIGTSQQARALKMIEDLIASEKFTANAAVMLLRLAVEIEREARGATTQRLELTGANEGPIAFSGVSIYLPKKDPEV